MPSNRLDGRRVRIVSDGLAGTSQVLVEAETGWERLEYVQSVRWGMDAGGVAWAELKIANVELDVKGKVRSARKTRARRS